MIVRANISGLLISPCSSFICRPSRKTKVSRCQNRKIISASLRVRDRQGQSTCHPSCRRLWRELAGAGRRRSGVRVKSAWPPAPRSSKSWTRSLGRRKGRRQGRRRAIERVTEKKFHCRPSENSPNANMRAGSMAQKVISNTPSKFLFQISGCFPMGRLNS